MGGIAFGEMPGRGGSSLQCCVRPDGGLPLSLFPADTALSSESLGLLRGGTESDRRTDPRM